MNLYVLGFAFDDLGRVALIRKRRPDWQAGRLNGIGGHIENHETAYHAMVREFYEETGVKLVDWQAVGVMKGDDWHVTVFTVTSSKVRGVRTATDEEVVLQLPHNLPYVKCIENVVPLVQLCGLKPEPPSMVRPNFVLKYEKSTN